MTSPTEAPRTEADTYEAWVQRVAAALHEDCILEWKAILVVDPKRELTQHATDAHYGKAHNLVRRLGLAEPPYPTPDEFAGMTQEQFVAFLDRIGARRFTEAKSTQVDESGSSEPSTLPADPADDPVLGDDGYPTEQELQRIREWSWEGGFRSLMAYVRQRWAYADAGYWDEHGDRFAISTAGWSGNESIIGALESNQMFSMLCPVSWRCGGHYVYDVQNWDDNPEPGKRKLVRDPATPMHDNWRVAACDCEARAASVKGERASAQAATTECDHDPICMCAEHRDNDCQCRQNRLDYDLGMRAASAQAVAPGLDVRKLRERVGVALARYEAQQPDFDRRSAVARCLILADEAIATAYAEEEQE